MSLDTIQGQNPQDIPQHIAIVMDGNGRWASKHGLPAIAGHKAGAEVLKKICQTASEIGIKYLTVYAFSTENWQRPKSWIAELMDLLKYYLRFDLKNLIKNNVCLHVIGSREKISSDLNDLIEKAVTETKKNTGIHLIIALNYGGRAEITHALKEIGKKIENKELSWEGMGEKIISEHLYTAPFPDPDLLIRTSGEMRISNFLLWQIAYAELYFTQKLWPEFDPIDFKKAIEAYKNRERRYGATIDS